jgi:predicted nucleotidyltransferase
MVSQDILKEAVRRLVEQFHPEKIILFGSQVRGTADSRSDITDT